MIFCTNCGQQNDDAARSCTNCGTSFGGKSGTTPFTTPATATAEPSAPQATADPWSIPEHGGVPQQVGHGGGQGILAIGTKRDPILVLVLSLCTCGIYALWWAYTAMSEVKNALGHEEINPTLDLVLTIVTCGLYGIYLLYKYPRLIVEMQARVKLPTNDFSVISLILSVVGLSIISFFMIQSELNKVWDAAAKQ
jgi:hypothetical protein